MKLSIIIPAYNEEKTIAKILKKVIKARLSVEKEIIVVDDGSTDNTREILITFHRKIRLFYKRNQGKGSAIRAGLRYATGDIIIIQDADLEYDPNDIQKVIDPILDNEADVVYGSRWMIKKNRKWKHFMAFVGGRILTWTSRFLCPNIPTTDEATCYKSFKSKLIKSIDLKCKGFEFCPEVTAKLSALRPRFKEVPIRYNPRSIAEGKKINWKDGVIGLWTLIKYSTIWKQGTKFALVGGIGLILNLCLIWFLTEFIGLYYLYSSLISITITASITFCVNRIWTFR